MTGIGFSYRKYIAVIALQIVLVMTAISIFISVAFSLSRYLNYITEKLYHKKMKQG